MIHTPRLVLESLASAHADVLFSGLSDRRLYEFIDASPPENLEGLRSRYQRLAVGVSPDGLEIWRNWAIRIRETGKYAGFVQATVNQDQSAAVAYVLFTDFQGRGYACEAVTAMLADVRDSDAVIIVRATVDPRHLRSIALLKTLGFQQVRYRVACVTIRETIADECVYERELSVPRKGD